MAVSRAWSSGSFCEALREEKSRAVQPHLSAVVLFFVAHFLYFFNYVDGGQSPLYALDWSRRKGRCFNGQIAVSPGEMTP